MRNADFDNAFSRKVKEVFGQTNEAVPAGSWEALQQQMQPKQAWYVPYLRAAAVLLLLLLVGTGIWLKTDYTPEMATAPSQQDADIKVLADAPAASDKTAEDKIITNRSAEGNSGAEVAQSASEVDQQVTNPFADGSANSKATAAPRLIAGSAGTTEVAAVANAAGSVRQPATDAVRASDKNAATPIAAKNIPPAATPPTAGRTEQQAASTSATPALIAEANRATAPYTGLSIGRSWLPYTTAAPAPAAPEIVASAKVAFLTPTKTAKFRYSVAQGFAAPVQANGSASATGFGIARNISKNISLVAGLNYWQLNQSVNHYLQEDKQSVSSLPENTAPFMSMAQPLQTQATAIEIPLQLQYLLPIGKNMGLSVSGGLSALYHLQQLERREVVQIANLTFGLNNTTILRPNPNDPYLKRNTSYNISIVRPEERERNIEQQFDPFGLINVQLGVQRSFKHFLVQLSPYYKTGDQPVALGSTSLFASTDNKRLHLAGLQLRIWTN
jgi:hypothetical protein